MDIEARPIGNDIWHLMDLLQRPVGSIVQTSRGYFIEHDDHALLMQANRGPLKTLDEALAEIEKTTGGTCRLAGG